MNFLKPRNKRTNGVFLSCLNKTIYKSKGVVNSHARSKLKTFKASNSKKLTFSFKLYCVRVSKRRMVYLNVRSSLHLKVSLGKLKLLFIVGMKLNTKILKWNFKHAAFLSNKIFYKVLQQSEIIFQTTANLCTGWVENSISISSRHAVLCTFPFHFFWSCSPSEKEWRSSKEFQSLLVTFEKYIHKNPQKQGLPQVFWFKMLS